jgi:hypothetical protein
MSLDSNSSSESPLWQRNPEFVGAYALVSLVAQPRDTGRRGAGCGALKIYERFSPSARLFGCWRLDCTAFAAPHPTIPGFAKASTKRNCSRTRILYYLRGDGCRGARSLRRGGRSGRRRLRDRTRYQRDCRRTAHRLRPQEPARCTGSRDTTAEVDGIDQFHLAAQGVWIWGGALPDPDQEPRNLRRVLRADRRGEPRASR